MSVQTWKAITNFGDSALLLPCVLLVTVWLLLSRSTRRLAVVWILFVVCDGCIVALTKLLYMGWHIGIPGLDFIGLSGHAALSFLVWPVLAVVMLGRSPVSQAAAAAGGAALAVLIAVSRVPVHAHSVSEVILGGALGAAFSTAFLVRYRRLLCLSVRRVWLVASFVLPLVFAYGRVMPTENMLKVVARAWTGRAHVYTRQDLHHTKHQ